MHDPESIPEETSSARLGYRFAAIPEWIVFHPDLSGNDVRVFAALARFADTNRACYPSAATIGDKVGRSERRVRDSLQALEAVGAIGVQKRRTSSLYQLAGDTPLSTARTELSGLTRTKVTAQARTEVSDEREPPNENHPPSHLRHDHVARDADGGGRTPLEALAYAAAQRCVDTDITNGKGGGIRNPDAVAQARARTMLKSEETRQRLNWMIELRARGKAVGIDVPRNAVISAAAVDSTRPLAVWDHEIETREHLHYRP